MMHKKIITVILCLLCYSLFGQETITARPSPIAVISMRYKDAYVKITYSQPHMLGRKVFGNLVPYGEVWRTGANEATEITATKDILLNNQILKAGTYTIYTIPEKDKWTIIINSEVGLWGSYNYNIKLDVMRFNIPVQTSDNIIYEPFTMKFDQKNEVAELLLLWDNIHISIPVKFI